VWFHDGDRVGHHGLEALLHRSIRRAEDGSLIVSTSRDRAPFVSEDAPLHVRTLEGEMLVFADGTREPCAGRAFSIDDEGRVRCASSRAGLWALLSRTATQLLLMRLVDAPEGEGPQRLLLPDGPCPLSSTHMRDWTLPP
jgi:hypothetical protein